MEQGPKTVFMLFSDIEGSTSLVIRLGEEWLDVLDASRRLCRAAWDRWHGQEMGTEGDSFFVAFDSAEDAVLAATDAQEAITAHSWPKGEAVRIRIGIHGGPALRHESGFVGLDVHKAARVCSAAHGGQTLVSGTVEKLVQGRLPGRMLVKDLGEHQLKDLPQAERLFQVATPVLPTSFPPPRAPQPELDPQVLIGREDDVTLLDDLVARGERLVSITGPGGCGKTALAREVGLRAGRDRPHGTVVVGLASTLTLESAWVELATALVLPSSDPADEANGPRFAELDAFVVLDNLEQLGVCDGLVDVLVDKATRVSVLATSRRRLGVPGEIEHRLSPLPLPPTHDLQTVARSPAGQLFVTRAHEASPAFELTSANAADVAAICERLDGLPLALELAAARSRVLPPSALLARLDDALALTSRGIHDEARQGSLRQTVAWSFGLLSPDAQAVFAALGAFSVSADLVALERVVAAGPWSISSMAVVDAVDELVDASLITLQIAGDGTGDELPRVHLLQTINDFAAEELAALAGGAALTRAHAEHYRAAADVLALTRRGPNEGSSRAWFGTESGNIRRALEQTLGNPGSAVADPDTFQVGMELCAAVSENWYRGNGATEGIAWLRRAINLDRGGLDVQAAICRCAAAAILARTDETPDMLGLAEAGVLVLRQAGSPSQLTEALSILAFAHVLAGDHETALEIYREGVAVSRSAPAWLHSLALTNVGNILSELGDHDGSLRAFASAIEAGQRGESAYAVAMATHGQACTLRELGRVDEARVALESTASYELSAGDAYMVAHYIEDYGAILSDLSIHEAATLAFGAADAHRERCGLARDAAQAAETGPPRARSRAALGPGTAHAVEAAGRDLTPEEAFAAASRQARPR